MARRYTLRPIVREPEPLDRPGVLSGLAELSPGTRGAWARRYRLRRLTEHLATSQRHRPADWLWLSGVHAAVAGWECPAGASPSGPVAEGWKAGRGLLPAGMPVALGRPLMSERVPVLEARPWEG